MIFNVLPDRKLVRTAGDSRRYAWVNIQAPVAPPREGRARLNVSFVLDRSGSMGGQKIVLVREAVKKALDMLRPEDRFSLVVYDDQIDVLVSSTFGAGEAKANAERLLRQIDARGTTDLGSGYLTGCEQISAHLDTNYLNRCLLLTDGLANRGITDHDELVTHVKELRKRGIATSTFGVGSDFDEVLLRRMAVEGGGNSYYIEKNVQIIDYLTSELGEALQVIAHDVVLDAVLPAGIRAELLNDYPISRTGSSLKVNIGEVISGQDLALVFALDFPNGNAGEHVAVHFRLADRDHALESPPATVTWEFADHQSNDKQPRNRMVDRAVAELLAARARDEARSFNRQSRYGDAQLVIRKTVDNIKTYCGDDAVLLGIVAELGQAEKMFAKAMSEFDMKAQCYSSYNRRSNRNSFGKAKRSI